MSWESRNRSREQRRVRVRRAVAFEPEPLTEAELARLAKFDADFARIRAGIDLTCTVCGARSFFSCTCPRTP